MKNKKQAFWFSDENGYGIKTFIIPKNKRKFGQDGIELMWKYPNMKNWKGLALKDWEALIIIEALTVALLKKKKVIK